MHIYLNKFKGVIVTGQTMGNCVDLTTEPVAGTFVVGSQVKVSR